MHRRFVAIMAGLCAIFAASSAAAHEARQGGKLLLTNGVSNVEGAAGGGLATWAVIGGEDTEDGIGGSIHATYVPLDDFTLTTFGATIGIVCALALSRAAAAVLYGVSAVDASTYGLAVLCLVTVAAAACWLPALRASRVDPQAGLRA